MRIIQPLRKTLHETLLGAGRDSLWPILISLCLGLLPAFSTPQADTPQRDRLVRDQYGAIVRGDISRKTLAMVFTGDEHGEGTASILDALRERTLKAAFFVTGNFLRQPPLRKLVERAIDEGHYVGPHSNSHPLYCLWDDRGKTLVTEKFFKEDLSKNLMELKRLGALGDKRPLLFIPPYEWYNQDQVDWCRAIGVTLINFTPGSGSNRDYAPEGDPRFVPSRAIYDDILAHEAKAPDGLNGFMLLMHLGSGRKDAFHPFVGPLCDELARRGYSIVRIDELLAH